MTALRIWWSRLTAFLRRRGDRDLDDEIQAHLDLLAAEYVSRGMSAQDARYAARRDFGGMDQMKERYRDQRGWPLAEAFVQDVRYALRTMRRAPGFTAAAILTLAVGIGANTAIFSIADATAFRPPDVLRPAELVRIFDSTKTEPYGESSYLDYVEYRSRIGSLSGAIAYEHFSLGFARSRNETARLVGAWAVSDSFFSLLGVEPSLGRGFRREDGQLPGGSAVAVISHGLWTREFGADAATVGMQVTLSGKEFTIIGVAPPRFTGTELYFHPDIFFPLPTITELDSGVRRNVFEDRSHRWLTVVARLAPGATLGAVNAELAALSHSLSGAHPQTNADHVAVAFPEVTARGKLDSGGYQGAAILLAIGGLVLLLACANVANLCLSRAVGRTREIAVRLSLGASRGRLLRQLLTESLLLAAAGGALGLLFASWGVGYVSALIKMPTDLPIAMEARVDQRVLLFALAAAVLTGILFGLTPALQSTRVDLVSSLKVSPATGERGRRRFTLRDVLVVVQVAVSVVVLTTAGLAMRAFVTAHEVDPGFRRDHVLLLSLSPGMVRYDAARTKGFYKEVLERTRALPGVEAAGLAQFVPLGISSGSTSLVVDGFAMPQGQDRLSVATNVVDAGYWRAMRAPIVRGRAFDERDTDTSPKVAIINETMARRYWPGDDALGRTIRLRDRAGPPVEVVGIARDGRYGSLLEVQQPFVFLPLAQRSRTAMTLTVLGRIDPSALAAPVTAQIRAVDPDVPVFDVRSLEDLYQRRAMLPARLTFQVMASLALIGIVLAVIGLYGVIFYLTARRTPEIGIRMALGAEARNVLLMVVRQAAMVVGIGLALGVAGALVVAPLMAGPFDINPRDASVFTLTPVVIAAAALAAALIPARRASRVDPVRALRCD